MLKIGNTLHKSTSLAFSLHNRQGKMSLQIILVALNACLLKAIEFFSCCAGIYSCCLLCCSIQPTQFQLCWFFFSWNTMSVSRFAELAWNYGYKSCVTRKQAAVSSVSPFQCLFSGQSRVLRVLECQFFKLLLMLILLGKFWGILILSIYIHL